MNIIRIEKNNLINGAGCRVVLWTAGCCHHCKGCHNPETHDSSVGEHFNEEHKKQLFEQLAEDNIDGITLTGGDPLMLYNHKELIPLLKEIKDRFPDKTVWAWTGFTWDVIKYTDIVKYIDVLVDGKFIEELKPKRKNLRYRGSLNQRVIDVQKSLAADSLIYWEDFDGWTSNKDKVKSLDSAYQQYKATCDHE